MSEMVLTTNRTHPIRPARHVSGRIINIPENGISTMFLCSFLAKTRNKIRPEIGHIIKTSIGINISIPLVLRKKA